METNQQLEDFNARVLTTDSALGEVISKIASLDFELKSLKNIVHESEDKGEKLEKLVSKYRHETYYTKQRLDDVEENSKYQIHLLGIVNTTGHLIWRIDEYSAKLADAKENDVALKSPMFTNKPYGYTLRVS
jgi:chromosome segregation ATPase